MYSVLASKASVHAIGILSHVWEYQIHNMMEVLFIKMIVFKGSGDLVGK